MEIVLGVLALAAWNIVAGVIDATDDRLGLSSSYPEGSGSRPNRRSARYSRRCALQGGVFNPTVPEAKIRREPPLIWSSAVPRPLNIPTVTRLSR
jgi:hypothetical protein